ncbi:MULTISPECIES: tRNA (adenosine(37)-N6)-dimethylallyltransferase MiaA [unclassified Sphingobacterium]|uniref:tRNA (adenosine(37)-N6)-dimethylallyltransferase MiaA n=1 Tax=unclassified Sphingobacterium TaxID=2609468 RepID=UPI0025E47C66|nr:MULTISPECIES: tRNA (adenosine(37)-N6)-dimethylallyltransferase MiaA [unclassified Sphingobacterium]
MKNVIIILGPTASGKTALAVALAKKTNGAIISADSRQVYRQMDIGTGKDLKEYEDIPYYLIDICEPGEKYNLSDFQHDFQKAYFDIVKSGKQPILCGGTGLYIQSVIQEKPYSHVPVNPELREELETLSREELQIRLDQQTIPPDLKIDNSTRKRMIRGLEILAGLDKYERTAEPVSIPFTYQAFGIDPPVEIRRTKISQRLKQRIDQGLVEEVEHLLSHGVTHDDLQYYGLEYKYISYYLSGDLNREACFTKLETEIHRYAKRQMTYFRKMEKDNVQIHWLEQGSTAQMCREILNIKKG